jgi:hypothetical protein
LTATCTAIAVLAGLVTAVTVRAAVAIPAASRCGIVVTAAHWTIRGRAGSGNRYTVKAEGMSCAVARPWVLKFTHLTGHGLGSTFKGPAGFTCKSFSEAASGDKLIYSGVCLRAPGVPFFEWGPKL